MSSNATIIAEEEILVAQNFVNNYCTLATCTLILYEHTTTFSQEALLIWGAKTTGATIVFILNRYLLFAYGVILALESIRVILICWELSQSCGAISYIDNIITFALYFILAAFSALRVYGIGGKKWHTTLATLALALVPLGTNIYIMVKSRYDGVEFVITKHSYHCELLKSPLRRLVIVARTCAIASDLVVLLVTWTSSYQIRRNASQAHLKTPLTTLILSDGTIYFVMLLIVNILQITLTLESLQSSNESMDYPSIFLAPMSSILVSRFIMDLRQVGAHDGIDSQTLLQIGSNQSSQTSTLQFSSLLIGHLDAPLEFRSFSAISESTFESPDVAEDKQDYVVEENNEEMIADIVLPTDEVVELHSLRI
ncbi:hypothetical protein AcW1_000159 [Taiwanofungus camphoratus]|nr:hypothetical protein AcW2_001347 [Antrodia cinnamomea]KAI0935714.1 hypothetical protein AcV5_004056 [Antrodia cinnamomea]KAI0962936.1 hypothetical protein AcW1_000159 [Antrodia cinnamomea]